MSLERRAAEWVLTRLGATQMLPDERALRLLEEAIELAQAECVPREKALALLEHVYSRPKGRHYLEAGGVAVCLFAWCASRGHRLLDIAKHELERIEAKPVEAVRASLARKVAAGVVTKGEN